MKAATMEEIRAERRREAEPGKPKPPIFDYIGEYLRHDWPREPRVITDQRRWQSVKDAE